jgi:hypothetical protein
MNLYHNMFTSSKRVKLMSPPLDTSSSNHQNYETISSRSYLSSKSFTPSTVTSSSCTMSTRQSSMSSVMEINSPISPVAASSAPSMVPPPQSSSSALSSPSFANLLIEAYETKLNSKLDAFLNAFGADEDNGDDDEIVKINFKTGSSGIAGGGTDHKQQHGPLRSAVSNTNQNQMQDRCEEEVFTDDEFDHSKGVVI